MSVVGIDFGDDYLTIACARRAGIDVLQNEIGKRKTRAGFSLHHVHRHIGDEFLNQFQSNTANCLIFLKRLLGKQYDDPDVEYERKYMYVKLDKDDEGRVIIVGQHLGKEVRLTPEQCVAVLLKQLAETYRINNDIGSKMKDCVISVPAYFSDSQRRSMITAAKIANLNVLR
uniref:Heat shock 70 kDa protein 4L n=1 Tax=Lygus hesperus TaxID=30085 RepID=A0A0A9WQG3_LYGHE